MLSWFTSAKTGDALTMSLIRHPQLRCTQRLAAVNAACGNKIRRFILPNDSKIQMSIWQSHMLLKKNKIQIQCSISPGNDTRGGVMPSLPTRRLSLCHNNGQRVHCSSFKLTQAEQQPVLSS